jgi:hypothetical protein
VDVSALGTRTAMTFVQIVATRGFRTPLGLLASAATA